MATIVDKLVIALKLDTSDAQQSLKSNLAGMQSFARSQVDGLVKAFLPLGGDLSLGGLVQNFQQTAEALGQLSTEVGLDVERLQLWKGAARDAGLNAQDFEQALGSIADSARQNGRSTDDELGRLADTFAGLSDMEALNLGQSLNIAPGAIKLLQRGRDDLSALLSAQYELGTLNDDDIERSERQRVMTDRLSAAITALSGIMMEGVAPAVTWVTEKVTDFVSFLRKHGDFTRVVFVGLAGAITGLLIPSMVSLAAAAWANPLVWIFAAVAAVLVGVGLLIDDIMVSLRSGKSLFDWKGWVDSIVKVWTNLKALAGALKDLFQKSFDLLLDGAKAKLEEWKASIEAFFTELWAKVKEKFPNFAEWAENAAGAIRRFLGSALDSIIGRFTKAFDIAKKFLGLDSGDEAGSNASEAGTLSSDADIERWFRMPKFQNTEARSPTVAEVLGSVTLSVDSNQTFNIVAPDPETVARTVSDKEATFADYLARIVGNQTITGTNPG